MISVWFRDALDALLMFLSKEKLHEKVLRMIICFWYGRVVVLKENGILDVFIRVTL